MLGSYTLGGGVRERGQRESPWWYFKRNTWQGSFLSGFLPWSLFLFPASSSPVLGQGVPETYRPSSSWNEIQTLPWFSGACRSGSAPEQDSSSAQIHLISWEQKLLCKTADTAHTIATIPGRHSLIPAWDNIWNLVHPGKKFPLHTAFP